MRMAASDDITNCIFYFFCRGMEDTEMASCTCGAAAAVEVSDRL